MTPRLKRKLVPLALLGLLACCLPRSQGQTLREMPDSDSSPPAFAALVAGRAALADSKNALLTVPRLNVSAKWFRLSGEEGKEFQITQGTETFTFDRVTNRLRLIATPTRVLCDGKTLQVSNSARRTLFRIPLEGTDRTLADALLLAQVEKVSFTDVPLLTLLALRDNDWPKITGTVYRSSNNSVIHQFPRREDDRTVTRTVRRYRFAPTSHLPLSAEDWTIYRDKGSNTTRTVYLSQEFTYTASALPASDTFRLSSLPGYQEIPPPSNVALPLAPGPDQADAKARALLARWKQAWARFTSFTARIHVVESEKAQAPEGRRPMGENTREAIMNVRYQRPGKLYAYSEPYGKPGAFTQKQTLISDGQTLAVYTGARQEEKKGQVGVPSDDTILDGPIREAGFHDFSEALPHLLENPQMMLNAAEKATYRGVLPVPTGSSAEAITITQSFTANGPRRGHDSAPIISQQIITLYFDPKTGLPIRSEFVQHRLPAGIAPADLPPDELRSADFTEVRINEALSPTLFQLPKTP